MIAARQIAFGKAAGGGAPSAKSYIQDGLVAMWDGIENAGWGVHDPSATVWKDLVGGAGDLSLIEGNYEISEDCVTKTNFNNLALKTTSALSSTEQTTEVCMQITEFNPNVGGVYNFPVLIGFSPDGQDIQVGWNTYPNNVVYRLNTTANMVYSQNYCLTGINNLEKHTYVGIEKSDNVGVIIVDAVNMKEGKQSSSRTRNRIAFTGYRTGTSVKGQYHSIRLYSRALTAEEIAHNYSIDKARF